MATRWDLHSGCRGPSYTRRRKDLVELVFGVAFLALLAAWVGGLVAINEWSARDVFGVFVFPILSPILIIDGIRNIRRRPSLIVAANGFDDRTGWRPAGPVLWSEVATVEQGSKWAGNHREAVLAVALKPGTRLPLWPFARFQSR